MATRLAMLKAKSSRGIMVSLLVAVALLALGVMFAAIGCGAGSTTTTAAVPADTIAAGATATTAAGSAEQPQTEDASRGGGPLGLDAAAASLGRKVISNATLVVEVAAGKFQLAFDQARNLADQYGGYIVSSDASATDEAGAMRNGTVVIRVPSQSFNQALASASKLGDVKSLKIESQDVTEEYVDLQARLANAQTQEKALISLMGKAKTVDEVLQVQQVLTQTQQEIEQLKGRIKFLDEHSSYSTVSISLYEPGSEAKSTGDWGFIAALKDALHAFVGSINDIIVSLGGALPVLALLALLAWIAYRIAGPIIRRSRERRNAEAARYRYAPSQPRPYPEGAQPQSTPYPDSGEPIEPPSPEDRPV